MTPDVVPVFPLPETVLFPHTVLPLHVFEPRYRRMVQDAQAGNGLIAVALLLPGYESDYRGAPAYHALGTVGRIEHLSQFDDGRFLMQLQGLERVELARLTSQKPYQVATVRPAPERMPDANDDGAELRRAKLDLLASHGFLLSELSEERPPSIVFDEGIPFEQAVNMVCAGLPVEAALRQELLEDGDLLSRQRRAAALMQDVLETVLRLKSLRAAEGRKDELN